MKKWEITLAIVLGLLFVGGLSLGAYWYIGSQPEAVTKDVQVTKTQEEKDLAEVESEINQLDDLNLSEVDSLLTDLETIDLSGV